MKRYTSAPIPAALAICLLLACTQQPAAAARIDRAASSPVGSEQGPDADSSTTTLAVTYNGPDVLQPLLTVTVQDRQNGVRTVLGRDLSTFREIGGGGYAPEVTLQIPVPDTIRARVQVRRADDDTTTVVDVSFSGAVVSGLAYRIHVVAIGWRPFGNGVIRVYATPLAHPSVPPVLDSLFVVWKGFMSSFP